MALAIGTSLGPYVIAAPLGAGGMGEVYRARDTRLGRDVAIKVILAELARDPERIKRFEQEARAAGALNHPGVCAIHDLGIHEGSPFVVMELLEGETLRERLNAGPIPVRKAIDYVAQAAHGLAAAHKKGIVHRDLKPENLFLTKDGRVKVLDFGLAKLTRPEMLALTGERPTSIAATETGAILGTIGYMAPEQVLGKAADARSDLFGLGAILYELLTGKRAFHGVSYVETLHAILNEEPAPLATLRPDVPAGLEMIVRHCMEKDPEGRFQAATDLAFNLETIGIAPPTSATSAGRAPVMTGPRRPLVPSVAMIGVLLAVVALLRMLPHQQRNSAVRFPIAPPEQGIVSTDFAPWSISPDGRTLAYSAEDSSGARIRLRSFESGEDHPQAGTDGGRQPFWSPTGRSLGFFADGKMKSVPLDGTSPLVLADVTEPRGGSWNREGDIIFADYRGGLMRVRETGGEVSPVTVSDSLPRELGHRWPCFLPDGRHFIFVSFPPHAGHYDVYLGCLDSRETHHILQTDCAPVLAPPGYLMYLKGQVLVAQRWDDKRLRPSGEPTRVVEAGAADEMVAFSGSPIVSASANDRLVFASSKRSETQLVRIDLHGNALDTIPTPRGCYGQARLSRDGRHVAVERWDPSSGLNVDIWLVDLVTEASRRFTFAQDRQNRDPGWSPDQSSILFRCFQWGRSDLRRKPIAGLRGEEILRRMPNSLSAVSDWSPDGASCLFGIRGELHLLSLSGDGEDRRLLMSHFAGEARFSPDHNWIAYTSDETGTAEVYVQLLSNSAVRYQISTNGGAFPRWAPGGSELLYLTNASNLVSVRIQTTPQVVLMPPRVLCSLAGYLPGSSVGALEAGPGWCLLVASSVNRSNSGLTALFGWRAASRN